MDWIKIKNEYINGNISYRKLAEKYNVSFATLSERARNEKWVELRKKQYDKTMTKTIQKTADKIVDRNVRLLEISDKLTSKINKAVEELDMRLTEQGKVDVDMVEVDRLNKLTKALKDVKDIQTAYTDVSAEDKVADSLAEFFGGLDDETE